MSGNRLNILFIDDDEDDYLLIKDLLSDAPALNFDLEWAKTLKAGLNAMGRRRYDVCLLDYRLGEDDGLKLLKELNKRASEVPVIFLTQQGDYEIYVEAMRLGAMDYLIKGHIDTSQLERSIRYSIERKSTDKELTRYRNRLEELVAERTAQLVQTNKSLELEIAERKRAEEEKARLVIAIEQAGEGIIVTNTRGDVQYVNPAFERISGYAKDEIIGRSAPILGSGEHGDDLQRQINQSLRQGGTWKGRITNRRKDGSLYEAELTVSPVKDASGDILNHVCIYLDRTHQAALERQLRQTQKLEAIGTMAGGIAHDFNNILAVISGHTELALMGIPKNSTARKNLERVLEASSRAADLVRQIITFSRMGERERKPLSLVPIVKEALKLIRATLPTTIDIRQEISIPPGEDMTMADPTQFHQVLVNLCANAADSMLAQGGILRVILTTLDVDDPHAAQHPDLKLGPYVKLTVRDTGQGIDPLLIERIFDPFFTTKKPGEGTGMGLAVVQGIVKDHGGAITVHSEPGKGTAFHVYLPRIGDIIPLIDEAEILPTGTEFILLVDDEKGLAELEKEVLESLGYRVCAKTSSLEALEAFRAQPDAFDLVFTDMTMPGLTGVELARELLAIRPGIPIILCTGYSEELAEERSSGVGIREFLMKPASRMMVAQVVRRALDGVGEK